MDKLDKLAFDLDFNLHKMSFDTVKYTLAELIHEMENSYNNSLIVGRLKYKYTIMNKDNYKDILD